MLAILASPIERTSTPSGGTRTLCGISPCGARHLRTACRRVSRSPSRLGSCCTASSSHASSCVSLLVSSSTSGESLGFLPSARMITTLARWCRVPISIPGRSPLRSRISCAALRVNVTKAISSGRAIPVRTVSRAFATIVWVLPVPAPATIRVRSSWTMTARRWSSFRTLSAGSPSLFRRVLSFPALRLASFVARSLR